MWTLVELLIAYCGVGLEAIGLYLFVQALLILIVPPLWVMAYRAMRRRHHTTPHLPMGIAWAQGILAWGIVAVSAIFQRRHVRVSRLRLLLTLNVLIVALIEALWRPDLQAAVWPGAGVCLLVICTYQRARTPAMRAVFCRDGRVKRPDRA